MPDSESIASSHAGPTLTIGGVAPAIIDDIKTISLPEENPQALVDGDFDADIAVIGAGPGGYVASIRAAQLGARTVCVEKEYLGGTCLNWGCIPSKVMIAGVERLNQVRHAAQLGVIVPDGAAIDFEKYMARKEKIVQIQRGGVGALFKKNGVRHVEGFARFTDAHRIEVEKDGKVESLSAKHFILAMGSSAIHLDIPGLDGGREENVWTSDDAVTAPFVPHSMLVIGGGAVGVEFGYVFNGLGSKVTLVEMLPTLIPACDEDLGTELAKQLGRQGIVFHTGATLERAEKTSEGWRCHLRKGAESQTIDVQVVLLGVGRKANTENMNLESIGVRLHRRGVEVVDDTLRTHAPNIYAIGDVTGRIQLAHVASAEGKHVVENLMSGRDRPFDYRAVPNCIYTVPEVATVGLSESEARAQGKDVVVGRFPFRPLGKAMAIAEQDGFVKVVADRAYGEILGVHMIGPHVTDLIAAAVAAIKLEATVEVLAETIHAHPTLAEAMLDAYEDALGHSIHKA